jgi:hypothetical protein
MNFLYYLSALLVIAVIINTVHDAWIAETDPTQRVAIRRRTISNVRVMVRGLALLMPVLLVSSFLTGQTEDPALLLSLIAIKDRVVKFVVLPIGGITAIACTLSGFVLLITRSAPRDQSPS